MAHEIDTTIGRPAAAILEGTPDVWWARDGFRPMIVPLDRAHDPLAWIEAAGLAWEIVQVPCYARDVDPLTGETTWREVEGARVNMRSDTRAPLAVVTDQYVPFQPSNVVRGMQSLLDKHGKTLETALCLKGGRRYCGQSSVFRQTDIGTTGKPDIIGYRALLSSSSDGTMANLASAVRTRVVCSNTLGMALHEGRNARVKHKREFDIDAAWRSLGFDVGAADDAFDSMATELRRLGTVTVSDNEARAFFRALLRPAEERKVAMTTADLLSGPVSAIALDGSAGVQTDGKPERAVRGFADLLTSYYQAPGAMPGTARGLLEATEFYVDHKRGKRPDSRYDSSQYGQGARLKSTVYDCLVEYGPDPEALKALLLNRQYTPRAA